ncbi:MAG: DUF4912 domain-containing protein [Spirochaetaceae bacterium]|jgi:hypothetical protein|nr:DUF4912 domain-containing protein [Spirochaetaceae bacterium]
MIYRMDDYHISRSYLEGLTTSELAALAEDQGIDVPSGLERSFIIEEILEASSDDFFDDLFDGFLNDGSGEETVVLEERHFLEPVPLPRQYNITYIDVIVRDPLWVYAFWEIRNSDKEILEKNPGFQGYYLKVSPLGKCGDGESFTVSVGTSDFAWYLGFSPESITGGRVKTNTENCRFRVEFYVRLGETQELLAVSRSFSMPSLLGAPEILGEQNQLHRLSGMEELPILRSGERPPQPVRWSQNRT